MGGVRNGGNRRRRMFRLAGLTAVLGLLAWAGVAVAPAAGTGASVAAASVAAASAPVVTATIGVGSDPTAVAVNQVTGAAYVANSGGNTVSVISGH